MVIKIDRLHEKVNKYLEINGVSQKRFAEYVGIDFRKANKWLHKTGYARLTEEQLGRVEDFLNGKFIKTIDEIMEEEKQG